MLYNEFPNKVEVLPTGKKVGNSSGRKPTVFQSSTHPPQGVKESMEVPLGIFLQQEKFLHVRGRMKQISSSKADKTPLMKLWS